MNMLAPRARSAASAQAAVAEHRGDDGGELFGITELCQQFGITLRTIRFYEDKGLVQAFRTMGNQRRFLRSDIRRLSFILIAQRLGLGLAEIEAQLATLPQGRTPTLTDWQKISRSMRFQIDKKIQLLSLTRAKLDECIGCGCLSWQRCQLYNRDDRAGTGGTGPRFVLD